MTLQTFRNLTATIPELTLRRALTLALSVERPTSPEGYARFYGRVLAVLGVTRGPDGDPAAHHVPACITAGRTQEGEGMTSKAVAVVC